MKNLKIYHAIAPVLALFAVGCSSPVAMQSTEYDDMYYSSSDRTEYVQPEVQASGQNYDAAEEGEVNAQSSASNATDNYYADEYYDGRTYRPQATWNTPNYAYVDPYWTSSYISRMNRYNAFYDPMFYDPFYDPYYDPFFYNPFRRSGLMVNIGVGYGWGSGWNRWGRHHDPFYGGGWWPYNNYYNGFYHGYHHGYYGGGNRYIYDRPIVIQPRKVQYGPRGERSVVPATGTERAGGRPARTQSTRDEQGTVQPGVDYARPSRTERANTSNRIQEAVPSDNSRQALPSRPSRTTRGYDPETGQVRPSRQQPASDQQIQRISPAREGSQVRPVERARPVQRQERVQPVQRQERIQPIQRQQPVQRQERTQPVMRQQRSESSQPVRSYEPARSYEPSRQSSGGSYSPPARSNSSSGGGRPGRGQ